MAATNKQAHGFFSNKISCSKFHFPVHQVNLNNCKVATMKMVSDVTASNEFLICVQEPYRFRGKPALIPKGWNYHYGAGAPYPRAMIVASSKVNVWLHPEFTCPDMTT